MNMATHPTEMTSDHMQKLKAKWLKTIAHNPEENDTFQLLTTELT